MTLPVYPNPISLGNLRTEFGGRNGFRGPYPVPLSDYYAGGYLGVAANQVGFPYGSRAYVPSSGALSLSRFHGAQIDTHYVAVATANQTYQASTGWSIDYFNGHLTATLATWSNVYHATPDANQLIKATTASLNAYGGWNQVAQVYLDTPNTIYYGTNSTLIKLGGVFYDGQTVNAYSPGGWCMAASWDGGNNITIYCYPSMNGTGDTGSTYTSQDLIYSFATVAGFTDTGVSYNGVPITTPNSSYTFAFR